MSTCSYLVGYAGTKLRKKYTGSQANVHYYLETKLNVTHVRTYVRTYINKQGRIVD